MESQSGIQGPLPVVQSTELGNLKVGMSLYKGAFFLVYVGVYIPHMEMPEIDVSGNMDSMYKNLEGVQETLSTVLPAGNVLEKFDIDILKEKLEDGFNGAWSSIGSLMENASMNKGDNSVVDEGYVSDEDVTEEDVPVEEAMKQVQEPTVIVEEIVPVVEEEIIAETAFTVGSDEPAAVEETEPATVEETEPTVVEETEPAAVEETEPAAVEE